jgi:hypothetical protein
MGHVLLNLAATLLTNDPLAASDMARAAAAQSRRVGHRYQFAGAVSNLMQAQIFTGDWNGADETYTQALSDDEAVGDDAIVASAIVLLRALRRDEQGLNTVLPAIESRHADDDPQDNCALSAARAAAARLRGDHAASLRHAQHALTFAADISLLNESSVWAWTLAVDAALALRDTGETSRLLGWLEEHPPGHIPAILRAERLRIRARLLAAASDPAASNEFETAQQAFRDFSSPYHLAVCLLDHADYLAPSDAAAVQQLVGEADVISGSLGARPLAQRAARHVSGAAVSTSDAVALTR